jgi:hypothetical protein
MLKTISAALLAVAVLAAPAMAATTARTAPAPIFKTMHKPAIKSVKTKQSVLNANARMGRHHHRHHHFHKHIGALKAHTFSKVSVKHATPAVKRG